MYNSRTRKHSENIAENIPRHKIGEINPLMYMYKHVTSSKSVLSMYIVLHELTLLPLDSWSEVVKLTKEETRIILLTSLFYQVEVEVDDLIIEPY